MGGAAVIFLFGLLLFLAFLGAGPAVLRAGQPARNIPLPPGKAKLRR